MTEETVVLLSDVIAWTTEGRAADIEGADNRSDLMEALRRVMVQSEDLPEIERRDQLLGSRRPIELRIDREVETAIEVMFQTRSS